MTGVWALAATAGGGIAAAGQSWTQYPTGSVPVYDTNGTLVTRAPLPNETVVTPGCRETILMAGEREIPVTECAAPMRTASQAAVTLLDRNGSILWQKGYGASGLESFWSLAAADGAQGTDRGHVLGGAAQHCRQNRLIHAGMLDSELSRGADQYLSSAARLHVECD